MRNKRNSGVRHQPHWLANCEIPLTSGKHVPVSRLRRSGAVLSAWRLETGNVALSDLTNKKPLYGRKRKHVPVSRLRRRVAVLSARRLEIGNVALSVLTNKKPLSGRKTQRRIVVLDPSRRRSKLLSGVAVMQRRAVVLARKNRHTNLMLGGTAMLQEQPLREK